MDLPMSHFWEICGQCTKFARVIKISQVLYFFILLTFLVAAYRGVFRTWSNIYNGVFLRKHLVALSCELFSQEKFHHRCSNGLKTGFYLRVWDIELTLVSSLQIKPRKYSAGKYVWHRFWKGRRSCWESKQNECSCRSSHPKGSFKALSWEIFQNSQKNICAGISFLIKLNSVDCNFIEI